MTPNTRKKIAGAIIAGGKSSRFTPNASPNFRSQFAENDQQTANSKALALLDGICLIEHVYRRLMPQVNQLWVNAPDTLQLPKEIDAPRIADANQNTATTLDVNQRESGPLHGVLRALEAVDQTPLNEKKEPLEWLLIAPCDTPFLPEDLSGKLLEQCQTRDYKLGIARSAGRLHPSVSLWHRSLFPLLKKAVNEENKAGYKQFYSDIDYCEVDWPIDTQHNSSQPVDPFFNINYAEDLEAAAEITRKLNR